MAINFNAYGIKSNDMNIKNLEVGQKLIRIYRPQRFDSLEVIKTEEYVITKVLKTRLVVETVQGKLIPSLPGQRGPKQTLRLLVDQSSWKSAERRGDVSATLEGTSDSYNRQAVEFATVDEQPLIDQITAQRAEIVEAKKIKNDAAMAVRKIASEMHPDLESVEAAIQALQALADTLRANA